MRGWRWLGWRVVNGLLALALVAYVASWLCAYALFYCVSKLLIWR
jgi:hypothetical protein